MKLRSGKLGIAAAVVTLAVWIICSLVVALLPDASIEIAAHLFHLQPQAHVWALNWGSFAMGAICWTGFALVCGWAFGLRHCLQFVATIYDSGLRNMNTKTYRVEGMSCGGCASSLTKALMAADPDAELEIDVRQAEVQIRSNLEPTMIQTVVEGAGFQYLGVVEE